MCRHEQVTIDRARRYWKTMADTNFNVFDLTPLDQDLKVSKSENETNKKTNIESTKGTFKIITLKKNDAMML